MITRILVTFTLIHAVCLSQAQEIDQELVREIYSFYDSSRVVMKNTRGMVFKYIDKDQPGKVLQILQYIEQNLNKDLYRVFTPSEQLLIHFYLGEYHQILESFNEDGRDAWYWRRYNNYDRTCGWGRSYPYDPYDYPDVDYRYPINLDLILFTKQDEIIEDIEYADLSPVEKDFLKLYLPFRLKDEANLSIKGASFVDTYPESEYADFVKINIRQWFTRGDDSFTAYFGGGWPDFNEGLGDYINLRSALLYGVEGYFSRKMIGLRFVTSYGSTIQEFSNKGRVFVEGTPLYSLNYTLSFGYAILDTDIVRITPNVDFGGIYVSVPEVHKELYPGRLSMGSVAGGGGFVMDIFPGQFANAGYSEDTLHRLGIRIQAGRLYHLLENIDNNFQGYHDYYGVSLVYDCGVMKIDMR